MRAKIAYNVTNPEYPTRNALVWVNDAPFMKLSVHAPGINYETLKKSYTYTFQYNDTDSKYFFSRIPSLFRDGFDVVSFGEAFGPFAFGNITTKAAKASKLSGNAKDTAELVTSLLSINGKPLMKLCIEVDHTVPGSPAWIAIDSTKDFDNSTDFKRRIGWMMRLGFNVEAIGEVFEDTGECRAPPSACEGCLKTHHDTECYRRLYGAPTRLLDESTVAYMERLNLQQLNAQVKWVTSKLGEEIIIPRKAYFVTYREALISIIGERLKAPYDSPEELKMRIKVVKDMIRQASLADDVRAVERYSELLDEFNDAIARLCMGMEASS